MVFNRFLIFFFVCFVTNQNKTKQTKMPSKNTHRCDSACNNENCYWDKGDCKDKCPGLFFVVSL